MLICSCFDGRVENVVEECLFCQGTGEVILNSDTVFWMVQLRSRLEAPALDFATQYHRLTQGEIWYFYEIDWEWDVDRVLFSGSDSFDEHKTVAVSRDYLFDHTVREQFRLSMLLKHRDREVVLAEKERQQVAEAERKERELYEKLRRKYGDGSL
jgi:hypothetical protein